MMPYFAAMMPGVDLGGNDLANGISHHPPGTLPSACQAVCAANKACGAWTYVIRGSEPEAGVLERRGAGVLEGREEVTVQKMWMCGFIPLLI